MKGRTEGGLATMLCGGFVGCGTSGFAPESPVHASIHATPRNQEAYRPLCMPHGIPLCAPRTQKKQAVNGSSVAEEFGRKEPTGGPDQLFAGGNLGEGFAGDRYDCP